MRPTIVVTTIDVPATDVHCVKRGYRRRRFAKRALRHMQSFPGHGRKPRRIYRCDRCGLFHLTSSDQRKTTDR